MKPQPPHGALAPKCIPLIVLLVLAGPSPGRAQGVHIALMPPIQNVSTGAEFDLQIDVTQAGSAFNGFKAVVSFDPAALTLITLSPVSLQQGCLMTGACSNACGNTFHNFNTVADSAVISDILLCLDTSLTGPGHAYKLHFRASNTPQVTDVHIRRTEFYNAGVYVNPVYTADSRVGIGIALDASGTRPPLAGLRLSAEPNPAHGSISFAIEAEGSGVQTLEVLDVSGRLVRRLESGWQESGVRHVQWDGTNDTGIRVPTGIYLARLRVGDQSTRLRIALIQ